MLVLNRRKTQELVFDGDIRIVILGVNKKSVKFGIHAPREVPIGRLHAVDPAKPHISEATTAEQEPTPVEIQCAAVAKG